MNPWKAHGCIWGPVLWMGLTWGAGLRADLPPELTQAVGRRRPLVVHVGAGDARTSLALAKDNSAVLHGVEPDAAAVERAQAAILEANLCGRVLIERSDLKTLPHVNGLANIVVVDDWKRVTDAGLAASELLRVLAPEGFGWVGQSAAFQASVDEAPLRDWLAQAGVKESGIVKRDGIWAFFRKDRPGGMDEWTHKWHDATRNAASQDRHMTELGAIQWIGSDPYTWQMRHGRTAGGRVVLMYDATAGLSRWGTYKEDALTYEVFDAYSGVLQWKRKYSPAIQLGFDPVATGDRIITPIGKELRALDAATGDDLLVYGEAAGAQGGVVCDGVLVVMAPPTVKGIEVATGRRLWTHESKVPQDVQRGRRGSALISGLDTYCVAAGDGLVFISEKSKVEGGKESRSRVYGLDVQSGDEKWSFSDPSLGEIYSRLWYYQGRLMVTAKNGLYGLPVKSRSKDIWRIPVSSFDKKTWTVSGSNFSEAYKNFFGVNGRVWVREGTQAGMRFAEKADSKPQFAKTWVGYDAETGQEAKRVGYDVDGGWQQRCFPDQATPAFILSSNNEIVDLATGSITNYRAFRGMCGEGPFYGNGMYYVPTHYCIFCYPMVRGTIAVAAHAPPATPVADGERLEKGPAYRESMTAAPAKPEEWPTYRQNSKRTSGTTAALKWPVSEAPEWKAEFGERITAPSIAQGRLFAAIVNQGRIVALDAATGKVVWTRVAGPRIDTPPTVHGDQVLFGSHDGYLYALRASDGALAWRFFAAPERRRMVACDRVESAWPLMGSALVADGVLYAVAGRITRADGGMHLYALDPVNGAMKWHRTLSGTRGPELATGIPCWRELEGQMMNNMLVCDGDELRLPDEHQVWQFSARTGDWMPRKAPAPLPDQPADSGASFLAWYSEAFPWLGYDRPTVGWLMHGMDPVAELRHPYEAGTPSCYPAADRLGLIVKRMRRSSEGPHSVLIPTRAGDVAQTWAEEKSKVALPWKPAKLMSSANPNSDVYALVAAGETVVLACTSFAPPQQAGELRALSLKDGQELPSVALPATPAYDGMAAAYGKLFVTLRDGRLLCLGGK